MPCIDYVLLLYMLSRDFISLDEGRDNNGRGNHTKPTVCKYYALEIYKFGKSRTAKYCNFSTCKRR